MTGDVVVESVGQLFATLHELQVLRKVLGDHLRVIDFELDLIGLDFDMRPVVAGGEIVGFGIEREVSESICVEERVVPLFSVLVLGDEVGDILAKGARVHVSVR